MNRTEPTRFVHYASPYSGTNTDDTYADSQSLPSLPCRTRQIGVTLTLVCVCALHPLTGLQIVVLVTSLFAFFMKVLYSR